MSARTVKGHDAANTQKVQHNLSWKWPSWREMAPVVAGY